MKKTHIDYPINDDTLYRLAEALEVKVIELIDIEN